ncbi:MAG: carboxypeptidase-like regulatory domain-containing protein, partial [Acidobacteria bacterium]|nr:carboxypeptidase-like regulatory domain-containing protein [Acidobacteriota bacterium]
MKRSARSPAMRACISVAMACFFFLSAFGQSTRGSMSGLINDSAGAVVSGATVIAKHIATGEEFRSATDAQGAFVFPSLPLGQFTVTIEASGFKRSEVQRVMIEVATPAKLSVALEVGAVSEAVVVTSESQEVVNTTSPTLTNVINT